MKNKRLWSFVFLLTLVLTTIFSTGILAKAESNMKYLKVNQTTLEFNQIIYVDGTNGNDTNGDGSKENPFATVVKGFDYMNENCSEGGAIVFADGTYDCSLLFGYKDNLNAKYSGLSISLFSENMGKTKLINLKELVVYENDPTYNIGIKMYGFMLEFIHPQGTYSILGGDELDNEFYNCVIPNGYSGFYPPDKTECKMNFQNCLFTGNPSLQNNVRPMKGYALNCASTTINMEPIAGTKTNALYNVAIDSNYNITSNGWKNTGTGTNPDGSQAHIGVYGGQYAWGSKAEEISQDPQPSTRELKVVLEPSEELQLSVDEDILENTKMIWASSDLEVATIDSNGIVRAIKKGTAVITVTSSDGTYTENIKILVVGDAKNYRLTIDLNVGERCRLTIDEAEDLVGSWSSMDSTIVTVTEKGRVTAVAKGLTIVTGLDENGKEVGQVYIRVG